MVWFKVDDSLAFHAKVLMAGNSAMGLWVRAGAWSSAHLTDGFIPGHVALAIGTSAEVEHLVMAGLWNLDDGGYRFHEWTDRNPTADTVKARRDATSARQQRWREHAQQKALEASNVDALRDRLETPTRPDPTRPDQEGSKEPSSTDAKAKKPSIPLPRDWMPTAEHRALARERGVSLDWQADQFRIHAEAHDRRCAVWNAAFTQWLKKADPSRDLAARGQRPLPVDWMNL